MEAAFVDVVTLSGRHDTTETLSRLLAVVLSLKQIEAECSDVAGRFTKANRQVDDRAGVASANWTRIERRATELIGSAGF